MDDEPLFETSVKLPYGFALTARVRPSTIKSTVLHVLPWAVYLALPQGRMAKTALFIAIRTSPLLRQKVR